MELALDTARKLEVKVGDAVITANILPATRISALSKKHTKMKFVNHVRREEFDAEGFSEEFWNETIESWTGLSSGGVELPCTREIKFKVCTQYPEIAQKIQAAIDEAKEAIVAEEDGLLKN